MLDASLDEQEVSITELFGRFEAIPLETTDSCLLIWPDKVFCVGNEYAIFDSKHPAVFVFDESGNFVRKIGEKGNGPQEYLEVYDALYDATCENICMLSPFGEVFSYSLNGEFVNRSKLPAHNNYQSFELLNDKFVTWTLPADDETYGISILSRKNLELVQAYWKGNRNLNSLYPRAFHVYDEEVYFSRPFDRKVYKVQEDSLLIAYEWNFHKDNYAVEKWGVDSEKTKGAEESTQILKYLREGIIPYVFTSHFQTDKYYYTRLVFNFTPQGQHHLFYRKNDGTSYSFKKTKEGIRLRPLYSNNEFLLTQVTTEELGNYKSVLSSEVYLRLSNREEDANPIILKCYYK